MRVVITLFVGIFLALGCGGGDQSEPQPAPAPAPAAAPQPSLLPVVTASDTPHDEDCTMADPREFTPFLATAQPNASAPVVVRGEEGLTETVRLNSGPELRVSRGGCHDIGEVWTLAPAPASDEPEKQILAAIGALTLADPESKPSILRCLAELPKVAPEGDNCGDAYIAYSREGEVLKFTWSFSL